MNYSHNSKNKKRLGSAHLQCAGVRSRSSRGGLKKNRRFFFFLQLNALATSPLIINIIRGRAPNPPFRLPKPLWVRSLTPGDVPFLGGRSRLVLKNLVFLKRWLLIFFIIINNNKKNNKKN